MGASHGLYEEYMSWETEKIFVSVVLLLKMINIQLYCLFSSGKIPFIYHLLAAIVYFQTK